MEYNSQRERLVIPEYGRHIQKMVTHACSVEDREERNKIANAIVSIMGQMHPQVKDVDEYAEKLWTHLFIISEFKLDVDSPYPKPASDQFTSKPNRVPYPNQKIRYKHYGKVLEMMINEAIQLDPGDPKDYLVGKIANLMKKAYLSWNRDTVNDQLIIDQLAELSNNQLKLKEDFVFDETSEILSRNNNKKKRKGPKHKGRKRY
ncbi:MAG: DUF4290 domain-containing protein [Flavobacteriales bacterium]|nr:DUF4290 domain-containing protein [Flavobacteriales bacterium]